MPGVSPTNNPNWRNDMGLPPKPPCTCGHPEDDHPLVPVGREDTWVPGHQEYQRGPCNQCHCTAFASYDPTP